MYFHLKEERSHITLLPAEKNKIKDEIRKLLASEREIEKIIIFGSFLTFKNPHDIDIAIFQNSNAGYLALALKYRKLMRPVSKKIPVDLIPLSPSAEKNDFLMQIELGEVIYEK